jgi:hypothetical protein
MTNKKDPDFMTEIMNVIEQEIADEAQLKSPAAQTTASISAYDKIKNAMSTFSTGGITQPKITASQKSAISKTKISTGTSIAMKYAYNTPSQISLNLRDDIPTNDSPVLREPKWRLVMGLLIDETTNKQRYVTHSYFCKDAAEAKGYFRDDHLGTTFTSIFVINGTE